MPSWTIAGPRAHRAAPLDDQVSAAILDQVRRGARVRRSLPPDGTINIDRQLPFLVVHRPPASGVDPSFRSLVTTEAAYLVAPSAARTRRWTSRLVAALAREMADVFGAFLILELWASPIPDDHGFEITCSDDLADSAVVEQLAGSLRSARSLRSRPTVEIRPGRLAEPPGLPRLIGIRDARAHDVHHIGLQVGRLYLEPDTGEELPTVRRQLARHLANAVRRAAFEFARQETSARPLHHHALGRRAFVRAVRDVDGVLAEVAQSFDLLLTVTPTNVDAAFAAFRRNRFDRPPALRYRPITVDAFELKRRLYAAPVERVEDPTMELLFREKVRELDLKLTLISERERPRFLPTSMALYGPIDHELVTAADELLRADGRDDPRGRSIDAVAFAQEATREIDRYRGTGADVGAEVQLREDTATLVVSSGHLLVGTRMTFPEHRVRALVQHEVGTHIVTYWNGRAQPFHLLATGLANHDELQEGLAVFAEHLVGGLTGRRLETLAARVLAARSVVDGATFVDTFRLLHDEHGIGVRQAFHITTRVHRGGGFTKDAVYLRGLKRVTEFLRDGGRLETLLVGKIAVEHAPVVEELLRREVLVPPPLRPSYLDDPDTFYRIERVRQGVELRDLIE